MVLISIILLTIQAISIFHCWRLTRLKEREHLRVPSSTHASSFHGSKISKHSTKIYRVLTLIVSVSQDCSMPLLTASILGLLSMAAIRLPLRTASILQCWPTWQVVVVSSYSSKRQKVLIWPPSRNLNHKPSEPFTFTISFWFLVSTTESP